MAFDFPSVATEKRKAKEKTKKPITTKGNTVKEEKEDQKSGKLVVFLKTSEEATCGNKD